MEKEINSVLVELEARINKTNLPEKNRTRYINNIKELVNTYKDIDIPERHMDTYNSLIKKGKQLSKDNNYKDHKKIEYFLRYCNAAVYDFKDNIKPLNTIMKAYLLTCALFMALAPQFFSFILPLLFVVPIFIGLKGMKTRSYNGLLMGVSVVPMGILTSIVWIKNIFLASGDFTAFFTSVANQYNTSIDFARNLTIVCVGLSVILLFTSITMLVTSYKHRKMFV